MYSVWATLFVIGVFLVVAGFLGRIGTEGVGDVSENVAASLALLVTYGFLIISSSSFSELSSFFEGICGGIPFLRDIADYGSLQNVISQNPLSAAVSFLDTVILSATINIIMMLPLVKVGERGEIMVRLLNGIIVAIASLLLLNYVIKRTGVYQWIVSALGCVIALFTVGTIPMQIISLFRKNSASNGIGIMGGLLLFSQSRMAGVLRASLYDAAIYVCGIWVLETRFGSIANGLSQVSAVLVAFGPVVIMIIGLVFILKSAKIF